MITTVEHFDSNDSTMAGRILFNHRIRIEIVVGVIDSFKKKKNVQILIRRMDCICR